MVTPTTAAPAVSPTPSRTPAPRRTSSPKPHPTHAETATSTADPVTGGSDLGTMQFDAEPSPTPTSVSATSAGANPADKLGTLITLTVVAALMLGAGGVAGLYLTRDHRDH